MWHFRKDGRLNIEDENILKLHNQSIKLFELYGGKFYS